MSIYPHPSHKGWWVVDIGRGKTRQRIIVREGGLEEAEARHRMLRKQSPDKVLTVDPTIKELMLPFLKWYKQEVSPGTYRDAGDTYRLYFVPTFGNLRPSQLTVGLFTEFKETLLDAGQSKTNINKHLSYISKVLKWAATAGHCQDLQFTIPRYPRKQTVLPVEEQREPLTREQLDEVYSHVQPHYRLPFLLMADMGLRRNEALLLKVSDIDLKFKAVNVLGKGNKIRRVPFMSARFEEALYKVLDTVNEGYLTVNPKEKKPYLTMRKELLRVGKKAGLKKELTHHILRYTFSTICAENGMSPYALQKVMGHSSIETTMKIYTKVNRDFVAMEVEKMREGGKKEEKPTPKLRLVKG